MSDAPQLIKGIWANHDEKFDLQLDEAFRREHALADAFATLELKSERFIWESSGNLAIEFRRNARPSGIAVTTATLWVHELIDYRDGTTLVWQMVPMPRMKRLARTAIKRGLVRYGIGDRGEFDVALVPIEWLTRTDL